jgi:tetratricopeptide (TPR) repeat protein
MICGSKDDILRARELFERAIAAEPDNARAHVGLAITYARETSSHWSTAPREAARKAFEVAQKAVDLDIRDSEAHLWLAWGYFHSNSDFDLAANQVENAIKINPNDCHNYCFKSWLLTCAGETDSGIACANEALRRNPLQRNDCLYTVAVADYLAGRYEHALTVFSQVSTLSFLEVHAFMAACYAELGRGEDARREVEEFLRRAEEIDHGTPAANDESWRAYWTRYIPFKNAAQLEQLLESFRKAGLPARA